MVAIYYLAPNILVSKIHTIQNVYYFTLKCVLKNIEAKTVPTKLLLNWHNIMQRHNMAPNMLLIWELKNTRSKIVYQFLGGWLCWPLWRKSILSRSTEQCPQNRTEWASKVCSLLLLLMFITSGGLLHLYLFFQNIVINVVWSISYL